MVDRKKWILEAAKKAFSSYGYKSTTMDQVAKIANVGKGTIYLYFNSKEELFAAIIEQHVEEMIGIAQSVLHPEKSFFENAHSALYAVLDFRMQQKFALKLVQEQKEHGTKAVEEAMKTIDQAIIVFIQEKIERAIERGELKPMNSEITAFILLKLYIAIIYEWEQSHKPLEKEEIGELFKLYFIKGVLNE